MNAALFSRPPVVELAPSAQQIRESLEQALGAPLEAWIHCDGRWVRPSGEPPPAGLLSADELDAVWRSGRPQTLSGAGGQCVLAAPLPPPGGKIVLAGAAPPGGAALAAPLASAILANFAQRREVDDLSQRLGEYALCVTNSFEELSLLRSLAEHIDVCDPRASLASVAQTILPALRDILRAEAVLLFVAPGEGGAQTLAFSAGDASRLLPAARTIIARFGQDAVHQPVVGNVGAGTAAFAGLEGVASFVLTPIAKGAQRFGWLAALNRQPWSPPNGQAALGDDEFGTSEAGLLQAAGIMLATQAANSRAFRQIEQLLIGIIRAMINVIDAKDAYTCGHSDRVALISKRIAQALGLSRLEQERVYMAGLLHDIGKIGVPDQVLGKPDRLSDEEFAQIKRHPEIGCAILQHLGQLAFVLPGVLHHHESFNGRGYPHSLTGEAIPLLGRIIAVADAYDAMTSDRPYRPGMPAEKAEAILRQGAGTQWDPQVVEAFFQIRDEIHQICGDRSQIHLLLDGQSAESSSGAPDPIAQAISALLA